MADTTTTAPCLYTSINGSFHTGAWDDDHKRPIIDGKFEHPVTGLVTTTSTDSYSYLGPPSVDIVILNLHESGGVYRAARPFPVEKVLWHVMRVVKEMGLQLHSLNASTYSATIVLASDLEGKTHKGEKGFSAVSNRISNGLWDEPWGEKGPDQEVVVSEPTDE
jgi:hypothetical protein